ncbi:MAG: hypothetical protein QOF04_1642, partial [Solirubrobacteraceae bacterium]|nr:hypothetical protein [Solirubrobacteraceae bacterium]
MRSAVVSLLAALALLLMPAAAGAQAVVDRAAEGLRQSPVYEDPSAENELPDAEIAALRREIQQTGKPIFIAILPASAGAADGVVVDVARAAGRTGTYAVIVGNRFRVVSNSEPQRVAVAESRAALNAHRDEGVAAVLEDFVRRTAEPGVQADGAGGDAGGQGGGGGTGVPWLLILLLGGGGLLALR